MVLGPLGQPLEARITHGAGEAVLVVEDEQRQLNDRVVEMRPDLKVQHTTG